MVQPYDTSDTRFLQYYVYVESPDGSVSQVFHGSNGTVESISWDYEADRVPTCTFRLRNPPPTAFGYRSKVQIAIQSIRFMVFRGVILDPSRDESGLTYECVGRSWSLDVPYQTALGIFQSPITNVQAVTNMLGNAGVDTFSDVNLDLWTLATNSSQILQFGTWGDAIKKVIEPDDAHWYEDRFGNIHVSNIALLPSTTPTRTYFAMRSPAGITEVYPPDIAAPYRPRIRSGVDSTDVRATKNRIISRGYSVNTVNPDGTTTSAPLTKEVTAPSAYVVKPDGTQDYSDFIYSNELMDTQAKVDEVADRYLAKLNRLHHRMTVEIDGDPRVMLGETVRIVDYDYTGVVGNFAVLRYSTSITGDDFVTVMELLGGPAAPNQDPIAAFTYRVEREVMSDRVYAFVTFDATASYDLDGEIASYSWSDNQGTDIATGTAPIFTVRVDPSTLVEPWIVTLTVTDDAPFPATGTATYSLTVDISADGAFTFTPAFVTAFDTRFSGTPNGGQTWYDQVGTSVISTAAGDLSLNPGIAIYGTTAGGIWRTTDYCLTFPTQVLANTGSPMIDLEWDRYVPARCWGITNNGRVYRSDDQGVTWILWDTLTTVFGSSDVQLYRVHSTPKGVRVYGALNNAPLIARDVNLSHNWIRPTLGGELGDDLPGPSDIYVADAAWHDDDELAIILNHSGGTIESGLSVAQGTYLGNGTTQTITNKGALGAEGAIGFTPRIVIVKANTAANSEALIRIEGMTACRPVSAGTTYDQGIGAPAAGGFTVTQTASVEGRSNAAGVTYHFWVIGGDAIEIGTYVGDEGPHEITGLDFSPVMFWVMATELSSSTELFWLSTSMEGRGGCLDFNAGDIDNLTDHILSLNVDGASLGSDNDVSDDTITFIWVAFKNVPNLALGRYGGDSVDGRQVPDSNVYTVPIGPLAFTQDLVTIKVETANNCVYRDRFLAGDLTFRYNSGTPLANKIQVLNVATGKWEVGTNVDVNVFAGGPGDPPTHTYHYFAFEDATGTPSLPLPTVYYTDDIDGDGDAWKRAVGQPSKTRGRWIAEDMEQGKFAFAYNDTAHYHLDVSDVGNVNASPAAATLDANDAPNHGLFVGQRVQGMAGVYVVSAEGTADGTLYKTFDRFATIGKLRPATGFPASPAGANAKMSDLGKSVAPQAGDLIIARSPTFLDDTYPRQIADLSDGLWSYIVNPASALQTIQADLRRIGGNLYRLVNLEYDSHTNGGQDVGEWERSTDGGVTWVNMTANGLPAKETGGGSGQTWGQSHKGPVADAAGNLWMPCGPNNADRNFPTGLGPLNNDFPILYKSIDNGVSWTSVFTDTGTETVGIRSFREVLVHPSDPSKIAIWGSYWLGGFYVWWSTNGGASFSLTDYSGSVAPDPDGGSGQDITELRWAVATASGAVVFTLNIQTVLRLNTWGAASGTVELAASEVREAGAQYFWGLGRTPGDMLIAHVRTTQDSFVFRSFDLGSTWELMASIDFGGAVNFTGLYYDPPNDALYYVTTKDAIIQLGQNRVFRQANVSKPFVGETDFSTIGTWFAGTAVDLTLNLDTLFSGLGFGEDRIGTRCVTKGDAGGYASPGVM